MEKWYLSPKMWTIPFDKLRVNHIAGDFFSWYDTEDYIGNV